jgi:PAS domain S-box-containing protein
MLPDQTAVISDNAPISSIVDRLFMKVESELSKSAHEVRFPLRQFLILSIPIALAVFAITFAFSNIRVKSQLEEIVAGEQARLHFVAGFMAAEASIALNHLVSLAQEEAVQEAIDSPLPDGLQFLESVFMTLARGNPNYQQIRWIDEAGNEIVRVTREQQGLVAEAADALQDKSGRYYFQAANALAPGDVYISRLDLNVEHGQVEKPFRPTLRVATPITDRRDQRRGIVIINVEVRYMLDALRVAHEDSVDTDYFLVNDSGYWFTASNAQDQVESEADGEQTFSEQHPDAWAYISASDAGNVELPYGFWVWEKLSLDEAIRRQLLSRSSTGIRLSRIDSGELSLKLVAHKPVQTITQVRQAARMPIVLSAILVLAGFIWGILFFVRGLVAEKQAEIDVARAKAQASQMKRLKELEERFHLLVEACNFGLVVIDAEGVIVMTNPAAESMLGYKKGALAGVQVDTLLPAKQRDRHTRLRREFFQNPEVRMMGRGRRLEALTADGRRLPVEVGLNPYLDHGKQVVLASIVDLSQAEHASRD